MELWFTEKQTENLGISCRVKESLHRERTSYQDLAILDTVEFGRILVLDGIIQTTEQDEFTYHEMLVHVALSTLPRPRRVCVIGGGDGGSIREVLKHPTVEQATLVEIDPGVVRAARAYLPRLASGLADPRVKVIHEDGVEHVRSLVDTYDAIVVDSPDPIGAAVGLFSFEFYRFCHAALTESGILVAQTESPFFNPDLVRNCVYGMSQVFPITRVALGVVPSYPGGLWSYTMGSKRYDPAEGPQHLPDGELRYYSPEVHRAAFALPGFVRELVDTGNGV